MVQSIVSWSAWRAAVFGQLCTPTHRVTVTALYICPLDSVQHVRELFFKQDNKNHGRDLAYDYDYDPVLGSSYKAS